MPSHSPARSPLRWAAALMALAFAVHAVSAASAGSPVPPGAATTGLPLSVERVQAPVPPTGPAAGRMPSVSGDGHLVVSVGPASDGRDETVVLTDRTVDLSVDLMPMPSGLEPGGSVWPVLSTDGCTVTVLSEITDGDLAGAGKICVMLPDRKLAT